MCKYIHVYRNRDKYIVIHLQIVGVYVHIKSDFTLTSERMYTKIEWLPKKVCPVSG